MVQQELAAGSGAVVVVVIFIILMAYQILAEAVEADTLRLVTVVMVDLV